MKERRVVVTEAAQADIRAMVGFIAQNGAPRTALAYAKRLREALEALSWASERGTLRQVGGIALRVVGFESSATIAFSVDADAVVVLRVFYRGRDWERDFEDGETP